MFYNRSVKTAFPYFNKTTKHNNLFSKLAYEAMPYHQGSFWWTVCSLCLTTWNADSESLFQNICDSSSLGGQDELSQNSKCVVFLPVGGGGMGTRSKTPGGLQGTPVSSLWFWGPWTHWDNSHTSRKGWCCFLVSEGIEYVSFSCPRSLIDSETSWRKRKQFLWWGGKTPIVTGTVSWRVRLAASPDWLTEDAGPWASSAAGSRLLTEAALVYYPFSCLSRTRSLACSAL